MNAWQPNSPLDDLFFIKQAQTRQERSWERIGGNVDWRVVELGATRVMADLQGTGMIKLMCMTTYWLALQYLRKLVIEKYWILVRVTTSFSFMMSHGRPRNMAQEPRKTRLFFWFSKWWIGRLLSRFITG